MNKKNEKVLVTGATGHLGSYLTRLLLKNEYQVTLLVRPSSNLWRISDIVSSTKVIQGDLSNIEKITYEISQLAPDWVFHLAWDGVGKKHRNDFIQFDTNLIGTLKLLQTVLKSGCKSWTGIGSQAEYGPSNVILREDLLPEPESLYGAAKLSAGLISQVMCEKMGIRYLWFRILTTYGPKEDSERFIPSVILSLLSGKKPALTTGEQRWDFLYVEDAVEAIYEAAINSKAKGIFNLASGKAYYIKNIAEKIRDMIDPRLPLGLGEISAVDRKNQNLEADITRFQECINWTPKITMEEGLAKTIKWYREFTASSDI